MIIQDLAKEYPQLYLLPGADAGEPYRNVVKRGQRPKNETVQAFNGGRSDRIFFEQTPAGPARAVYLAFREDFENFLRIMGYRCEPVQIPPDTGAMMVKGIVNWGKIHRHKEAYTQSGGLAWKEEFEKFTSIKENYTDTLIVLGKGYYSGVQPQRLGLGEEEWLARSWSIRLYHECTHFTFYTLYPGCKHAVLDEVIADAVGIIKTYGEYRVEYARLFLGVENGAYTGGRLENYLNLKEQELGQARQLVPGICAVTDRLGHIFRENGVNGQTVFAFIQKLAQEYYRPLMQLLFDKGKA